MHGHCPALHRTSRRQRAAGGTRVRELSEKAVGAFLSRARYVQPSLSSIPVSERLAIFDEVSNVWVGKVSSGRLSAPHSQRPDDGPYNYRRALCGCRRRTRTR